MYLNILSKNKIDNNLKNTAFVKISEGCNNFCSYCIVPFTRGREKHRSFKQILDEAVYLTRAGYKEIILLGQNVNSWEDKKNNMKFHDLLALLARELPVKWIRFITSYPGYYDNELIGVMEKYSNIARHIHFPVQSGSTRILKKMNRTYTRTQYLKIINDFKKRIPEITFSSDFIIGFPQETERDFELTMSLLKKVEYDSMFSFIYSKREHTKAKEFKDNLTKEINKERLYKLQNLQKEIQLKHNKALIGKIIEVLVTGINKKNTEEFVGRTESYKTVNFKSKKKSIIGSFVNVKIERIGPYSLRGIAIY
jgi:tRNA-2-methylthio-N6-dimethylallyladenosine synthase